MSTCPSCGAEWRGTYEVWSELDWQDHKGPKTYSRCCHRMAWSFPDGRFPEGGEHQKTMPPRGGFGP